MSTYEEFIEDQKQKKLLDREYRDLLISELLLAAMHEDHISVRKLAACRIDHLFGVDDLVKLLRC